MSDILLLNNELNIHDIMMDEVSKIEETDVAVFTSSGIDSRCIVFALLEAGKRPHIYSFTLNDRESRDFKVAEDVAEIFDLSFTPIYLPTDLDNLIADLYILRDEFNCRRKTEYQCTWPFLYAYPKVTETVVANGIRADSHFCISKRARLHFKDDLDAYRRECFSNPTGGQLLQHQEFANRYGKKLFQPYRSQSMIDYFMGTTYEQCNTPHQKQPILNAFPEQFSKCKVYPHTNFQLGDSGITGLFDKLLDTPLNTGNYKSVVGILNTLNKNAVGEKNGKRKLI